jgi:hypothetical protein
MKEVKLGNIQFNEATPDPNRDPYIIGSFGPEGGGKSRFALTGPEIVGFLALERKSYATIDKDAALLGKRVWKPKDPEKLMVNMRKAKMLGSIEGKAKTEKDKEAEEEAANNRLRQYYRDYANMIYDATYALLEHPDVRLLVIDTFTQMCNIIDSALYGFKTKYIKIKSQTYQDRREYNQEIIDFLNSLSSYKKHVILTHRQRDEYKDDKPTGRKIFEGFKFLGNYTNILIAHETNPNWSPTSEDESKHWHYALTVRTCQQNPLLEGAEYRRFLTDDDITFPNLIMSVNPDVDVDTIS